MPSIPFNNISMLNQLKDHLIEFSHLPEVEDDTIWANDRNEFFI